MMFKTICTLGAFLGFSFSMSVHAVGSFGVGQPLDAEDCEPGIGQVHSDSDFGRTLAIHGSTLMVGEPRERYPGPAVAGSVSVYELDAEGNWNCVDRLRGATVHNARFGAALAIDGSTAMVGALGDQVGGQAIGRVHVYDHDGAQWLLSQVIDQPGAPAEDGAQFGFSVAIDGNTAVVGAPFKDANGTTDSGTAYVYRFTAGSWQLHQELTPLVLPGVSDWLGLSVAISGDTIVVGEPELINLPGADIGSAHVFVYDAGSDLWVAQSTLASTSGNQNPRYGYDVAVSGSLGVVFEPATGQTYVYRQSGPLWNTVPEAVLFAGTGGGFAVDIAPNTVLAGHETSDEVRLYRQVLGLWSAGELLAGAAGSRFGGDVVLEGPWAAIGAPADDALGIKAGAVFVYPLLALELVQLEGIITDIESMELESGIENALTAKAEKVVEKLNAEDITAAINQLNAMQNQVNAQRGKKLTEIQADELIDQIQSLLAVLTALN